MSAEHENIEETTLEDGKSSSTISDETTTEATAEVVDDNSNVEIANEKESTKESTKESEASVDFKEKFYYMAAEFENLKRRHQREKENLIKFGNERVLSDLLEVYDNLERTLAAIKSDEDSKVKNITIGIEMVSKQLTGVMSNNGLTLIETIGKQFDPNFHEAMGTEEVEGKESGEITKEFQSGWMLNGRLLRPSKVNIAK